MDIVFFCKMCKEDKKHMDLDWQPDDSPVRFKCFSCGEYNSPPTGNVRVFGEVGGVKNQSIAEEIMEPLEIILKKLVRLSNDSVEVAVSQQRVFGIAQEMDAAMSFLRRNVEGLVTSGDSFTMPDEFYEDTPLEHWEPTEGTTKYVGDFSDYLYMTAPREDGGEK